MESSPVLPPHQHLAAPGKWPLVGEKRPRVDASPWTVTVQGLVRVPLALSLDDLQAMPQVERVIDIHCVTRWSKLGARFSGVPLTELLLQAKPQAEARFISFVARSERNHSTSLSLTDALQLDTLIALRYEGAPLSADHGGPVRTVVPNRYFYKSLKWLERIELLAEDRPGYWEAESGYHNHADPWQEERYIAAAIPRAILIRALQARDFSGLDLRGILAQGRELTGLQARDARLRDAHFEGAILTEADFTGANLSNAHLLNADVRRARFLNADLEGADFSGADLRGADFSGASLFGATFCQGRDASGVYRQPARVDTTTRISSQSREALAPVQQQFLASSSGRT